MAADKIKTEIYIDKDIKEQAQKLFSQYNISLSEAVNLFLTQSVLNKGIFFKIDIQKKQTNKIARKYISSLKNKRLKN